MKVRVVRPVHSIESSNVTIERRDVISVKIGQAIL